MTELVANIHEDMRALEAGEASRSTACVVPIGISSDSQNLVDRTKVIELDRIDEQSLSEKRVYHFVKRTFDVISCTCALAVLVIPMLLIAMAVRVDSHGPALFKQARLGKNGKPFVLYKFRTMYVGSEADGAHWTSEADRRITKVGNILRKTHLDEIPQFWNVVKGDMSLIGPRPERAVFYEEFERYIHGFSQRLLVKPGISGLAQVNGGYKLLPEEKVIYDLEYIKSCSVGLDARIVLDTLKVIVTGAGAR